MTAQTSNLNATPEADLVQPPSTATFWGIGPDGHLGDFVQDAYGGAPGMVVRAFGGTGAAPAAVSSGTVVGQLVVRPYDGNHAGASALIQAIAAEDFTTSAHGTYFEVWTTPAGGTDTQKVAQIGPAAGEVVLFNLPSSDPANAGQLWNNAGALSVSAG